MRFLGGIQLVALLLIVTAGSGCVRRRLTIRSNPPGAMCYVDEQQIGATPVSSDFTYYGTRRIRLVKDGYETISTLQRMPAPWYEIPPFDFVSENLVAREIRDERVLDFELKPKRMIPTEEVMKRANQLRSAANTGVIVPRPVPVFGPGATPDAAAVTTPSSPAPGLIGPPPLPAPGVAPAP